MRSARWMLLDTLSTVFQPQSVRERCHLGTRDAQGLSCILLQSDRDTHALWEGQQQAPEQQKCPSSPNSPAELRSPLSLPEGSLVAAGWDQCARNVLCLPSSPAAERALVSCVDPVVTYEIWGQPRALLQPVTWDVPSRVRCWCWRKLGHEDLHQSSSWDTFA